MPIKAHSSATLSGLPVSNMRTLAGRLLMSNGSNAQTPRLTDLQASVNHQMQ